MKAIGLLLLGVAGTHAQTSCSSDSNGDGRVGVDVDVPGSWAACPFPANPVPR
eukprot:COSAG03_NODE_4060_length_1705_cov_1.602740_1_plen_52_part_01